MPQKHTLKEYAAESYYHVFFRGVNKQAIFIEAADYSYFLNLLERYLGTEQQVSKTGELYPSYAEELEIVAFCLMRNHVHMLLYQKNEPDTMSKLMRSLLTSYSKYFNRKYHRVGSLFESRYKAIRITSSSYLTHISRYIHMNPRRWLHYRHSSLKYYLGQPAPDWLKPRVVLKEFTSTDEYLQFLHDYEARKAELALIKDQLADK